ncbi:type II toxin-antitoxin system HigB family toxin [Bradyrhizobium sp. USDA 4503]
MDEVRQAAPHAVILNAQRARFEVAGGNYRLIVMIHFRRQIAYVNFIGTHAECDKIDALTVSMFQRTQHGNSPDQERWGPCRSARGDREALECCRRFGG